MRRCAAGNTSHLAASGIMHPHLLPGAGRCLSWVSMFWHPCGLFIHLAPWHWRDYKPIQSLEHSFTQFLLEGQLKLINQLWNILQRLDRDLLFNLVSICSRIDYPQMRQIQIVQCRCIERVISGASLNFTSIPYRFPLWKSNRSSSALLWIAQKYASDGPRSCRSCSITYPSQEAPTLGWPNRVYLS